MPTNRDEVWRPPFIVAAGRSPDAAVGYSDQIEQYPSLDVSACTLVELFPFGCKACG